MLFPQFSYILTNISDHLNRDVMSKYINHIGKKFGKWTVIDLIKKKNRAHYIVKCECGHISTPAAYHVVEGFTSSCKYCAPKKHGHYNTPTYRSWNGARNRCNNPNNKDYAYYGGRGIKMHNHWDKYENFLAYMGEKPKGLTLDRINNDGDYEPGNCRWATYSQQNSNQRKRLNGAILLEN